MDARRITKIVYISEMEGNREYVAEKNVSTEEYLDGYIQD